MDHRPTIKTTKLLEENLGVNPYNLGLGNDFLAITQKEQATKEIDTSDLIKIVEFCASNDTIKKLKR